jgi:dihydropteroate synthase
MNQSQTSEVGTRNWPASRATVWQLRTRKIELPQRPLLMGIVNVTPDSFSDGGRYFDRQAAIDHACRLVADGADLLDIGGESTRPGSNSVSLQEELDRVLPVVEAVCRRVNVPVSIDTSTAAVAQAAIDAGAEIINDVTALCGDPKMIDVAVQSNAGVCAMHMQGTPQTMQLNPHYDEVVKDVFDFLRQARGRLTLAGISPTRICLDPGIGFGKTPQHNISLLDNCWRFHELGCPLLVGHSRKSFLAAVTGDQSADRTAATIAVSCHLAAQGVQILRIHDVLEHHQALVRR